MLLKIVIIVILIVINILAFIYMYKNDSDEINYDKWCKMLQDETKDNIELIRKNEKRINELNKEIEKLNKYQLLAADLNQDGVINDIDFDILKPAILGSVTLPYKTKDAYNITYNLDEGVAVGYLRTKYTSEFEASLDFTSDVKAKVKKDGYTFLGWTGSNGSTPETSVTIAANTTGDLHYKANWQAN